MIKEALIFVLLAFALLANYLIEIKRREKIEQMKQEYYERGTYEVSDDSE